MSECADARRFLHGKQAVGNCCSCIGEGACIPVSKATGANFTQHMAFVLGTGNMVCEGCLKLLKEPLMRSKIVLCLKPGEIEAVDTACAWSLISKPPEKFVLSIPQSHKKHHWLYAGLSTPDKILIGTDSKTVIYQPEMHLLCRETVVGAIEMGVPVMQLKVGVYSPSTYYRFGAYEIDRIEKILSPNRPSGLVELLASIAPREINKTVIGGNTVIEQEDALAAEYLGLIARHSSYRVNRGLDFWGGYYLNRINRVARMPLAQATDRLMGYVSVDSISAIEIIKKLASFSEDEQKTIERAIADRPKLVVALAYAWIENEKSGGQNKLW